MSELVQVNSDFTIEIFGSLLASVLSFIRFVFVRAIFFTVFTFLLCFSFQNYMNVYILSYYQNKWSFYFIFVTMGTVNCFKKERKTLFARARSFARTFDVILSRKNLGTVRVQLRLKVSRAPNGYNYRYYVRTWTRSTTRHNNVKFTKDCIQPVNHELLSFVWRMCSFLLMSFVLNADKSADVKCQSCVSPKFSNKFILCAPKVIFPATTISRTFVSRSWYYDRA